MSTISYGFPYVRMHVHAYAVRPCEQNKIKEKIKEKDFEGLVYRFSFGHKL